MKPINIGVQSVILFIDVMGTDFNKTPKFSQIETEISKEAQAEVDAKKKLIKK